MLASRMISRGALPRSVPAVRRLTPTTSARALHNLTSQFSAARSLRPTPFTPLHSTGSLLSIRFNSTAAPETSEVARAAEATPITPAPETVAPAPAASTPVVDASTIVPSPEIPTVTPTPEISESVSSAASDLLNAASTVSPNTIGYLKSLGMDFGWGPSATVQWLLEHVHVWTDTPWWASILISVLLVRGAMFPFYCKMSDNSAMMKEINPIIVPITKRMRACQMENDQVGMMEAKAEMTDVLKRSGVKRAWLFFPFTQIPIFYGFYNNLRGMADVPVPGFIDGGIAWFQDLSVSDPYIALPLMTATMVSAQFGLGGEAGANNIAKSMKTVLMIVVPGISFAFTYSWPAALVFYIMSSTAWGLMQSLLLKWPRFRNKFNLYPLNPQQSINPLSSTNLNVAKGGKALKVEDVAVPKRKQWGAEGGLLDRLTGGQDEAGEGWSIKKWQTEAAERSLAAKHKAYERKRASAIALEKKKAELERERKWRLKRQQELQQGQQ